MIMELLVYSAIIALLIFYLLSFNKPKILKELEKYSDEEIKDYILHSYDIKNVYSSFKKNAEKFMNSYVVAGNFEIEEYYDELVLKDYICIELILLDSSKAWLKKEKKLSEFNGLKKRFNSMNQRFKEAAGEKR